MSLRVKIGLVLTFVLAVAIIINAIYTRLAPRNNHQKSEVIRLAT